jgi:hypothetical protein
MMALLLLIIGIVVGAGNVFMLKRTVKALGTGQNVKAQSRVLGSYVVRTVLVALVLYLGVRMGSRYALIAFVGILLGGGTYVLYLLSDRKE